jgi:phosphatidylserine/phosphatidylglycerophosphate/cardiolipin synthase-like enzyme
MKKLLILLAFLLVLPMASYALPAGDAPATEALFSPADNLEAAWIYVINTAKKTIHISCFGITNDNIANALIDKDLSGVEVVVCCDKLQSYARGSDIDKLRANGVEVIIKQTSTLEHNKMIAVDGVNGVIGSYNLSENAQEQDNSIVLFWRTPEQVKKIEAVWRAIYDRDAPAVASKQAPPEPKTETYTAPKQEVSPSASSDSKTVQCKAVTQKGTRCKRMTSDPSGYCWQHK